MNEKLKNKEDFMKKLDCHGRQADLAMTIGRKARCIAFTMADRRSSRFHIFDIQRIAFTMAEILLSLTIIGVVAAITLPALTGNINERTWNTQRKALYARISQAIALMPSLNGYGQYVAEVKSGDSIVTSGIDTAAQTFVTEGLAKVLKINNICDNQHLQDCGINSKLKKSNGSQTSLPMKFYNLNTYFPQSAVVAFETQNGESIVTYYNNKCKSDISGKEFQVLYPISSNICVNFIYDLNGKKGPNTLGKDMGFITAIYPTDSVVVAPVPIGTTTSGLNFQDAMTYCRTQYDDARLPNIEELISIFVNRNVSNIYGIWTSGTSVNSTDAWYLDYNSGGKFIYYKRNTGVHTGCVKR